MDSIYDGTPASDWRPNAVNLVRLCEAPFCKLTARDVQPRFIGMSTFLVRHNFCATVNCKWLTEIQVGMRDVHECWLSLRTIQLLEGQAVVHWEMQLLSDRIFRYLLTIGEMVCSVEEAATAFEGRLGQCVIIRVCEGRIGGGAPREKKIPPGPIPLLPPPPILQPTPPV